MPRQTQTLLSPMAKPVSSLTLLFHIMSSILLLPHFSHQLPDDVSSQSHAMLIIHNLLNYPPTLPNHKNDDTATGIDFCNMEPIPQLTIECDKPSNNITHLEFHGFTVNGLVPPLPGEFSITALFQALSSLPSLKVLSLVSLGLWGPLPMHVRECSSLQTLNLSSNFLSSSIPVEVFQLPNLQTLVLDHNLFTGQLPGSLVGHSLAPHPLSVLSLKGNKLNGSLPDSLSSRFTKLTTLQLSKNNFSGEIPDLSRLNNLQSLDLSDNSFGPNFPTIPHSISTLILQKNRIRFGMSEHISISNYHHLQKLDVSSNELVGPFNPSLLSLPSLEYLDISSNKLTGQLHDNMSCNPNLKFVDLSLNFLTGKLPNCLASGHEMRVVKYRWNCLSNRGYERQHRRVFCRNEALAVEIQPRDYNRTKGSTSRSKSSVVVIIVICFVGGFLLLGLTLLGIGVGLHRFRDNKKKPQMRLILEKATHVSNSKYTSKQFSNTREMCQMMKIGHLGLPAYRKFLLEEVKEMTENFNKSMLRGESSPRGSLYRGRLANGTDVTVRSLKMRKRRGVHTYSRDVELLAKLRHTHLVSALGHCFECYPDDSAVSKIHLVFESMPDGTLRDWLQDQKLNWSQRIVAATSVAKGIQFLQIGIIPGLYSNNIKVTDILLDQNLHVKISCYNLPLLAEDKGQVYSGIPLSRSKERHMAMTTPDEKRDDVYDFGVILLEVITGKAITTEKEVEDAKSHFEVGLKTDEVARRDIIDPVAGKGCSDNSLKTVMELCVKCLSTEPNESRPSIEDVLWNLQFAAQVQDLWQVDSPSKAIEGSPIFTSE